MTQQEAAREAFYDALLDDDAEALYERAPVGYLSTTPDGAIIKVNQTFLTWTGYDRRDLVGRRSFVQLLTPGGRLFHETHYAPLLRMQGQARELALDLVRADGGRLPALVNAVLERDPLGRPTVIRVAVFDATERRRYEQELLRAKERAEDSERRARELARTLQHTLLPPRLPEVPGLEVAAAYQPAGQGAELSGDFYDVFQVGPDDWVVALGDVCGKGVDAAVVTSLIRHTLRTVVVGLHAPRQALAVLNEVLLDHATDRFCTAVMVRLQRHPDGGWRATLASGGHPPALHVRAGEPPVPYTGNGPLVGIFPDAGFADVELVLQPGDALLLYTDGVTEARRGRELYGEDRLHAGLQAPAESAEQLATRLMGDVMGFQDGVPRDDVAIVAVRVPREP